MCLNHSQTQRWPNTFSAVSIQNPLFNTDQIKRKRADFMFKAVCFFQKDQSGSMKSLPQQNTDSEVWLPDYLTPSWLTLPNDQPVLAIIQPGETAMEALKTVCKVNIIHTCTHMHTHSSPLSPEPRGSQGTRSTLFKPQAIHFIHVFIHSLSRSPSLNSPLSEVTPNSSHTSNKHELNVPLCRTSRNVSSVRWRI